jgi:pimeloyl-ACP methyl ester carboxylesterase
MIMFFSFQDLCESLARASGSWFFALIGRLIWLVLALGCTSARVPVDPSNLKSHSADCKSSTPDAVFFRSLLANATRGRISPENFDRLLLMPEEGFYRPDQRSFASIAQFYRRYTPEDLYKSSLCSRDSVSTSIRVEDNASMTLVVLPGFMSEFLPESLFPEVVDSGSSSFGRESRRALQDAPSSQKFDQVYSLAALKHISVPLSGLIRAGSIDDDRGNSRIRVIYLPQILGSLESVGNIERLYPIYKRRLDKFFALIGNQPNIFIAGHSRGAPIALDFLAKTFRDANRQPWTDSIRGLISFNGALFGSDFVDAYLNPNQRAYQLRDAIRSLSQLKGGYSPIESVSDRHTIISAMSKLITFVMGSEALKYEYWTPSSPDIFRGTMLMRLIQDQIKPYSYFRAYRDYILRIRTLAQAIDMAITNLSHKERLGWWEKNTLPTHLMYLSLASTMASPAYQTLQNPYHRSLLESPYMDRNLIDHRFFRTIAYDYARVGDITINDGLIGVQDSSFWPEFHQRLNPKQGPYLATSLGIFGAHHLAMAYASITSKKPSDRNLFPRKELLESLASYINYTQKSASLQNSKDRRPLP